MFSLLISGFLLEQHVNLVKMHMLLLKYSFCTP